jgi:hypothetical protein
VSGRRFPFPSSFSPAPPHPPCCLFPCAVAQGWNSTLLDNARKFRMKFTVAVPACFRSGLRQVHATLSHLKHFSDASTAVGPCNSPPQGSGAEYPRGLKRAGWGAAPSYPRG